MTLALAHPALLYLGIFAVLPWLDSGQESLKYSSLSRIPPDKLSNRLDVGLKLLASLIILCLALALAGPYRREQWVERISTGAHVVLLVDRSSSMNENFTGAYLGGRSSESKALLASRLLAEFVERREDDLFALVAFSAAPIYVMPLTQDHEAILAALRAQGTRGHGVTNLAPGLAMALEHFRDLPLTGSRIVLLVSDGAARIEEDTREMLRQWFQDRQASLYWIYLRNPKSSSLAVPPAHPNESTTPEYFLHQYFQTLGVPYRAYEAENPQAVRQAIADVECLEHKPLLYRERLPREDRSAWCYGAAFIGSLILLVFRALEVKQWRS